MIAGPSAVMAVIKMRKIVIKKESSDNLQISTYLAIINQIRIDGGDAWQRIVVAVG